MGEYSLRYHEQGRRPYPLCEVYLVGQAKVAAQESPHEPFVGKVVYTAIFAVSSYAGHVDDVEVARVAFPDEPALYLAHDVVGETETDECVDGDMEPSSIIFEASLASMNFTVIRYPFEYICSIAIC